MQSQYIIHGRQHDMKFPFLFGNPGIIGILVAAHNQNRARISPLPKLHRLEDSIHRQAGNLTRAIERHKNLQ